MPKRPSRRPDGPVRSLPLPPDRRLPTMSRLTSPGRTLGHTRQLSVFAAGSLSRFAQPVLERQAARPCAARKDSRATSVMGLTTPRLLSPQLSHTTCGYATGLTGFNHPVLRWRLDPMRLRSAGMPTGPTKRTSIGQLPSNVRPLRSCSSRLCAHRTKGQLLNPSWVQLATAA
jgi:hypothetical protein